MKYQVDYKIHHNDENIHSIIFDAKNQEEIKIDFKKYCDNIKLKSIIISIIKL